MMPKLLRRLPGKSDPSPVSEFRAANRSALSPASSVGGSVGKSDVGGVGASVGAVVEEHTTEVVIGDRL